MLRKISGYAPQAKARSAFLLYHAEAYGPSGQTRIWAPWPAKKVTGIALACMGGDWNRISKGKLWRARISGGELQMKHCQARCREDLHPDTG